jgi:hypothetical protein
MMASLIVPMPIDPVQPIKIAAQTFPFLYLMYMAVVTSALNIRVAGAGCEKTVWETWEGVLLRTIMTMMPIPVRAPRAVKGHMLFEFFSYALPISYFALVESGYVSRSTANRVQRIRKDDVPV